MKYLSAARIPPPDTVHWVLWADCKAYPELKWLHPFHLRKIDGDLFLNLHTLNKLDYLLCEA